MTASLPEPQLDPVVETPPPSELVIGLVGAVGTDLDLVATDIQIALTSYAFDAQEIRLSAFLADLEWNEELPERPLDQHVWTHMDAGNKLRLSWRRGDALALLALTEIAAIREEKNAARSRDASIPLDRFAFIIRSLKHPEEVELLRSIYGDRFVLVAAYAPRSIRRQALEDQLTKDYRSDDPERWSFTPEQLMERDESETEPAPQPYTPASSIETLDSGQSNAPNASEEGDSTPVDAPSVEETAEPSDIAGGFGDSQASPPAEDEAVGGEADLDVEAATSAAPKTADVEASEAEEPVPKRVWGQNLRDTFHRADVFVDAREDAGLREAIERIMQILFAHPFRTPTRDEFGLFAAEGAARKSAELGRQVGASIATPEGDVIALGSNEVPKAGGGLYWENGDEESDCGIDGTGDGREFRNRVDTNDRMKREIALEIIDELVREEFLPEETGEAAAPNLLAALERTRLGDLIEFGRAVHAEMAALSDAARRGVPVQGCTLYTTTFPCHNCARHIVAAGIARVVYVAPYAKSQARELHGDAVDIAAASPRSGAVHFEPFVGVAPRRYLHLFVATKRKEADGTVVKPIPSEASLKIPDAERDDLRPTIPEYRQREDLALDLLADVFKNAGLGFREEVGDDGKSK